MPPQKKNRTEDTHLIWMNDEVQLLPETIKYFKEKEVFTRVD